VADVLLLSSFLMFWCQALLSAEERTGLSGLISSLGPFCKSETTSHCLVDCFAESDIVWLIASPELTAEEKPNTAVYSRAELSFSFYLSCIWKTFVTNEVTAGLR
jgi:hypothetical protein